MSLDNVTLANLYSRATEMETETDNKFGSTTLQTATSRSVVYTPLLLPVRSCYHHYIATRPTIRKLMIDISNQFARNLHTF